jgi:nicotinamide-nucleotide amidase
LCNGINGEIFGYSQGSVLIKDHSSVLRQMNAEIISIGTELLLGSIIDTNATFIAGQLPFLGIDLPFKSTVGDNRKRLVETLKRAWQRSEIIITTGGLGPTQDDITREAIADLLDEKLSTDSDLVQELQKFYSKRNVEMPQNNIKQATRVPSAQIIHNARGTAPGWWVEKDGHVIVAMPGPSHEMQFMWTQEILPRLERQFVSNIIISKTLKTWGLGESKVDELISPFLSYNNPTLATYAKQDGVHLRITAKASNRAEAEKLISEREREISATLSDYIWGSDSDTIEGIVGGLLKEKGISLATMEFETGGLLASTISNVSELTICFKGGLIAFSNEVKIAFGIKQELIKGAISAELAETMATIARNKFGSDIGIGITGVIGSTEVEGRLTGEIFIGIDNGDTTYSFLRNIPGDHIQKKQRAVISALIELRKILIQEKSCTS